jgi:CDP-4-dehydro-6-deoxyglucose reductase, E1
MNEKYNKLNLINKLVKDLIKIKKEEFIPGKTFITTGLAIFDELEINAIINSLFDGCLGLSEKGEIFEDEFAKYITAKKSLLVNSGSSANLIALNGIKNCNKLNKGEIITAACGFPTTVNPIIQLGFKPAFIDIDNTLNITPEGILSAINKNSKGIMFSHTLGNPSKIEEIKEIADKKDLFIIEDCCDAYGSKYNKKKCGSFGTAATYSFYPAHNITMGEGGAITTNDKILDKTMRSLRDWGRDCWCKAWKDNTCNKRFDYKLNNNIDYDHKYIYSQIGFNLKPLELQAAMGLEQLKKIDKFNKIRKRNYKIYQEELLNFEDYFELPKINNKADPVFFGLPLTIINKKIFRHKLIKFLNNNQIGTRFLFGGNLTYQPAYKNINYKIYQKLDYGNNVAKNLFWIGIHPGIDEEKIKYIMSKLKEFCKN